MLWNITIYIYKCTWFDFTPIIIFQGFPHMSYLLNMVVRITGQDNILIVGHERVAQIRTYLIGLGKLGTGEALPVKVNQKIFSSNMHVRAVYQELLLYAYWKCCDYLIIPTALEGRRLKQRRKEGIIISHAILLIEKEVFHLGKISL
ncbi:hypothetical protein H8356DRAFT_1325315 [Neocallimastix lanati (nom. inval.)]|nr:hypothetical protein H8356DRAFT_1325315 [Neocallimastix sp. JGI-2020a]